MSTSARTNQHNPNSCTEDTESTQPPSCCLFSSHPQKWSRASSLLLFQESIYRLVSRASGPAGARPVRKSPAPYTNSQRSAKRSRRNPAQV